MRPPLRVLLVAGVATAVIIGGGMLALGDSDGPGEEKPGQETF